MVAGELFYGRLWQQLTTQFQNGTLPHALLAGAMSGIGKRDFVGQFVRWALCLNPKRGACRVCKSCRLIDDHPSVQRLPKQGQGTISVDEIRLLSSFVYQAAKTRFVVIDHVDTLSTAAANALLKMLEEPSDGVCFILISDHPARILPTIKSRTQRLSLVPDPAATMQFVHNACQDYQSDMLLALADFAPLKAAALPSEAWFARRGDWLKSFWLLQTGRRTPTQALSFWQSALGLGDFLTLCHYMLAEVWRFGLGLPLLHTDLDGSSLLGDIALQAWQLTAIMTTLDEVSVALNQNVQEALCYERVMVALGQS